MRWLRFIVGLLVALTLHAVFDRFYPGALTFLDPYVILVIYYSMGGNIFGAIVAGVLAGFVQDAFSNAIFGLHAFSLTVCAYVVASINARLVLRGTFAFGACLGGAVVVNELVVYVLVNILEKQKFTVLEQSLLLKTVITLLVGMLVFQSLTLFLREEPLEATRRRTEW